MKISELMYDLRKLKNDHGDMDLLIHVGDGREDYVVSACARFSHEAFDDRKKYQMTVLGIHRREDVLGKDQSKFVKNLQQEIEGNYLREK